MGSCNLAPNRSFRVFGLAGCDLLLGYLPILRIVVYWGRHYSAFSWKLACECSLCGLACSEVLSEYS